MPNVESLEQHNVNYVKDDAFEREKKAHQEHNSDNFKFLYQEDIPHGDALDKYELTSGVDIGSGTGWFANYLVEQRKYKKVYAIEPSSSAIEIAKKIYPDNKKVKYINGFAEEEISKFKNIESLNFCSWKKLYDHLRSSVSRILNDDSSSFKKEELKYPLKLLPKYLSSFVSP